MSYTHYWDQKAEASYMQWLAIEEHFKNVLIQAICKKDLDYCIQYESNDSSPVLITNGHIQFNGIDDEGHETFGLSRINVGEFELCETDNKPYDKFVVFVLILAHNLAPGCYIITSDGDAKDWQKDLDQLNALCETEYTLPETV